MAGSSTAKGVFFYDLGNPECYLMAERIAAGALAAVPEWEPVHLGAGDLHVDRQLIEGLAAEHGLQPVRWPARWPPETHRAMLAATYAKRIGRAVAFSLAAFRQAFAGGRDLGDPDTVLIAAAACEMHPAAVLKALELRSVADMLEDATARALALGIESLPAIALGSAVFTDLEALQH
jgi:2-hydroxychromene-2-carboxylate isomerase